MSQSPDEYDQQDVRITGIMLPWAELFWVSIQIAIVQLIIGGAALIGLKAFGVI